MKRGLCMLLTVLMCLAVFPGARAETADEKALKADRTRIRWGMALTAGIAGNALDLANDLPSGLVRAYVEGFSRVDWLRPDKAIIVELSKEQMIAAERALGVEGNWDQFAPALAEYINLQFSGEYAQAARLTQSDSGSNYSYIESTECYSLIVLPYGEEIAVATATAYGSINGRAALVMSTREISQGLGEAEVNEYLESLAPLGAAVRVYEGDELSSLLEGDGGWEYDQPGELLVSTLISSQGRRSALLPALMDPASPHITDALRLHAVTVCLRGMETADQALLRTLADSWRTALGEGEENPVSRFLSEGNNAYPGRIAPPQVEYGHELRGAELKPDGTYLTVFTRQIPDGEAEAWYDVILEAALPAERIPERVEDADYIILCQTVYEGGVDNGDAHLHYPVTRITVHDAESGELLRELGSIQRTLSGSIMISRGDTWWPPLRTMVWDEIRALFEGE